MIGQDMPCGWRPRRANAGRRSAARGLGALFCLAALAAPAPAQSPFDGGWQSGTSMPGTLPGPVRDEGAAVAFPPVPPNPVTAPDSPPPAEAVPSPATGRDGTTDVPRSATTADSPSQRMDVRLVALLTEDGQQIDQGLVWRVYRAGGAASKDKLVGTHLDSSPLLKLEPGAYMVNAAFGRAHMTRKIEVKPGRPAMERFVLNAGGLRLSATVNGAAAGAAVSYSIYADERDQFDNRTLVMSGARPGLVHRLNAGIYQIVSRQGDANAAIEADVTVEAGKLTEVTVAHASAAVTFKLVARSGGEALPDTQWTIATAKGETVKESVGALPTHILAPGEYKVTAKSQGRAFQRAFAARAGEAAQVEVVIP